MGYNIISYSNHVRWSSGRSRRKNETGESKEDTVADGIIILCLPLNVEIDRLFSLSLDASLAVM